MLSPQQYLLAFDGWKSQPFHTCIKWICRTWAIQGYGALVLFPGEELLEQQPYPEQPIYG